MTDEVEDFTDSIEAASKVFDELCQIRQNMVAVEEGVFSFLTSDVITQTLESLADTAIMCRKQFIKLLIYQHLLEEEMATTANNNVAMGAGAFKRAGEDE